jgi:hypothetical protein
MPAEDGPPDWQRIDVVVDDERRVDAPNRRVDVVVPAQPIEIVDLEPVSVSQVEIDQQSLSFEVDRVGVPVLVRVSYFPNWRVRGADGPYRIAPNMMVVVPTDERVEMDFARAPLDVVFSAMTLAGFGLCWYWRRRGDEDFSAPGPSADSEAAPPAVTPSV